MAKDRPIESYVWQLLKATLSVVAVILYSRVLGATGRGSLSIYLLYVQVFLMLNELFVGSALANWISQYGLRRFLPRITGISLGMLALAGVLGYYSHVFQSPVEAIESDISAVNARIKPLMILGLLLSWSAVLIFQNIAANFFQSRGEIIEKNQWMGAFEVLKVSGLLILIFGLSLPQTSLEYVLKSLVLSGVVWSFFCLFRLWRMGAFNPQSNTQENSIKHTWKEGIWAQLGQIVLFFVYRIPLFMASYWMGDAAAGIFANALLVIDTLWIFANTMGTVVHGRALLNRAPFKQEVITLRFVSFSFWGTVFLLLGILCIPAAFFAFIFGAEFLPMKDIVIQAIPGILALSIFAPLGNLFHARNEFKHLLFHHSIGLIVMLFSFFLVFQQIESVNFTHLIWSWNFALTTILLMHVFRRNFTKRRKLFFGVNTLLTYRLLRKRRVR
jgi:O-antigen/teichoic acid export membrane protein